MSRLNVGFGGSTQGEPRVAVREAVNQAKASLSGAPGLCILTSTVDYDTSEVHHAVHDELPNTPIFGATTSMGLLCSLGVLSGSRGALGVLLLSGEEASFCVGSASFDKPTREAGKLAAQQIASQLPKTPKLLLLAASPGNEEALIAGIGDVFPGVPVFGGSAADHTIQGGWRVFTKEGAVTNGISLAAIAGDITIGSSILGPYNPTAQSAIVTQSTGRELSLLDARPATQVLHEWVGDSIATQTSEGGNILVQTSLHPLGILHQTHTGSFYSLLHPAFAHKDGHVDLFAQIKEGERVCLMEGSEDSLIQILPTLADKALAASGLSPSQLRGGFFIYCAGCAGSVGHLLDTALKGLGTMLGVPLLGLCTFGEQGFVRGVGNIHSNLSVSLTLFGDAG
jgi:hypothetical protein